MKQSLPIVIKSETHEFTPQTHLSPLLQYPDIVTFYEISVLFPIIEL